MTLETLNKIKRSFINLRDALDEIEDPKEKMTWTLSVSADMLHAMPKKVRTKFLADYEELRAAVIKECGEDFL